VKKQVQSMCFQDPQLKYLGQKAFASYTRSLHVQKGREVFDLQKYDLEGFAASLGLPGAPRIKFLKADAEEVKRRKNAPRMGPEVDDDVSADSDDEEGEGGVERVKTEKKNSVRTKYDRMFERKNQDVLAEHYAKMVKTDGDAGGEDVDMSRLDGEQAVDDDLFDVKRRIPAGEGSPAQSLSDIDDVDEASVTGDPATGTSRTVHLAGAKDPLIIDSKRREKLLKSKKKLLKLKDKGSRVVFDEEGLPHQVYEMQDDEAFRSKGAAEEQRRQYVNAEAERVREQDGRDKVLAKEKKREKREKRKERERAAEEGTGAEEGGGDEVGGGLEGGEDAMANFLADAQASGSDMGEEADGDVEEQPPKKQKKWFQKDVRPDSDDEVGAERNIGTFDELEAEAARLLA